MASTPLPGPPPTVGSGSGGGGDGGGTSDHRELTFRSYFDQHPIQAITGLQAALDTNRGLPVDLVITEWDAEGATVLLRDGTTTHRSMGSLTGATYLHIAANGEVQTGLFAGGGTENNHFAEDGLYVSSGPEMPEAEGLLFAVDDGRAVGPWVSGGFGWVPTPGDGDDSSPIDALLSELAFGAPIDDWDGDSTFTIGTGATLVALGPGTVGRRTWGNPPLDRSPSMEIAFDVAGGGTSALLGLALYDVSGDDPVPVPFTHDAPSPWTDDDDNPGVLIRFANTPITDTITLTFDQLVTADADHLALIVFGADAGGGLPDVGATARWRQFSDAELDVLTSASTYAPTEIFRARFAPFEPIDVDTYAADIAAMTVDPEIEGIGGGPVPNGAKFFLFNQTDPAESGLWTYRSSGPTFTRDSVQPTGPSIVDVDCGGHPDAPLELDVVYVIRTVNDNGGYDIKRRLPDPTRTCAFYTAADSPVQDNDSATIKFFNTDDGDIVLNLRAADFSNGADVIRRTLSYVNTGEGTLSLESETVDGINGIAVEGPGGIDIYSDGTEYHLINRWSAV